MLGNDISLSKVVKLSYMEGFYFWHAMRLFVCPLREIAPDSIEEKKFDSYRATAYFFPLPFSASFVNWGRDSQTEVNKKDFICPGIGY